MKPSGVEWIGDIPQEWEVIKLKYATEFKQIKYSEEYGELNYIGLENIISWNGMYLETSSQYDREQSLICEENDILFGKLRPYLAKVYLNTKRQCCSSEFCVIKILENNTKYFWYQLISHGFIFMVDRSTYGTKMPRANSDFIRSLYVSIPPLSEQQRIAEFLDRKCAEIDSVISKTKATIEEYKALKQAVITQAVTKGIRPDRPMKDSGVEWIGDIPQEWEIRRIKTLFSLRDERNDKPLSDVNLISLYTDLGAVQRNDVECPTGNKASNADGYKLVYKNDIVVNIILCWMGAIGRSDYNGVTSPAYDIYIPSSEANPYYYHYYFRTQGFSGDCYKRGKGIMAMRWRTYSDEFRDIRVVYPSVQEQQEIADYLDSKCAEIDRLISAKEQLLTELESYKKSVIYEYVTGKKEV